MLRDSPFYSTAQRHQLTSEWNDTRASYPRGSCIHSLFEAQTERTPDAVAIVFDQEGRDGGRQVSYRELWRQAVWLARHLESLGIGLEVPVGVCLDPSPEIVICLLAILESGGHYVPLDPNYPRKRLSLMIEDAGIDVVLTREGLCRRLPADSRKVFLNQLPRAPAEARGQGQPRRQVSAENLAYLMYTSGSTGRPKAVSIPHRGVIRLVRGNDYARFGTDEVYLQLAPISFDASTLEIWGALLHGGRLVIPRSRKLSLDQLGALLERRRVTVLWLTAGLFHLALDERPEIFRHLRQLLAGGDVLSLPHVRRFLRQHDGCALTNGYGPTENTTFTCCWAAPELSPTSRSVPIGRPIMNTSVYVVGDAAKLVPIGDAGEFWIGGDGLGRGYLNRAALNAEKFVPNPFAAGKPGQRLYRSGDRVRCLVDGNFEFLGRIDLQVKIRGFRVEPGEVESVLATHPRVRRAIVVASADKKSEGEQETSLIGYFLPDHTAGVTAAELRAFLAQRLPAYMVPGSWRALEAIPLSPIGKVDRHALPPPNPVRLDLKTDLDPSKPLAPRTASEEILTRLWEHLLKIDAIGIDENFFELGGHSLLATQVASRVRRLFDIELPLQHFFAHPTIAALARWIDQARRHRLRNTLASSPPRPVARDGELPLSFAQQRLWFLQQLEPQSSAYNLPQAWRLDGRLDVVALARALGEILRRHEILRTRLPAVDGRPRQAIAPVETPLSLTYTDLTALPEDSRRTEARRRLAAEAGRPFDLEAELPLRVVLVKLAELGHLLFVNTHHIASDGWSQGNFNRELSLLYRASAAGGEARQTSSTLPVQYADFAQWQRRRLRGETLEAQLAYWRRQLDGLALLDLPNDRPRPVVQTYRGAEHRYELPEQLSRSLRRLSVEAGASLYMTLLAAFMALLSRLTGQHDVAVSRRLPSNGGAPLMTYSSRSRRHRARSAFPGATTRICSTPRPLHASLGNIECCSTRLPRTLRATWMSYRRSPRRSATSCSWNGPTRKPPYRSQMPSAPGSEPRSRAHRTRWR